MNRNKEISGSELKSIHNFRDLGGMIAGEGKKVRQGIIYRSANPDLINRTDLEILQKLGISSIIDLRAPGERTVQKLSLTGFNIIPLPLDFEQTTREKLMPYLKKKGSEEMIANISNSLYIDILDASVPVLKEVIEVLLTPEKCPVLIHCQAGKDRTGIISALILLALGADREMIIDDFMKSNDALLPFFKKMLLRKKITSFGFFPSERVLFAITVRQRNIESIIDRVNSHYGGIEGYLSNSGFDISRLPELKQKLLEHA